jgi:protein ImuB
MKRRFIALWFPHFAIDRWRRANGESGAPFALAAPQTHGVRLTAVDDAAAALDLAPGRPVAEAHAMVPLLRIERADPAADQAMLAQLVAWCARWSPSVAADGDDGLALDIAGCAHLFGGEAAMLADMRARLAQLGFATRGAVADTAAAAWAWAHYGRGDVIPIGETRAALADLPVAALRLADDDALALRQLGLRRIGDLHDLPRGPLNKRFPALLARLDAAHGAVAETFVPQRPPPRFAARRGFAEPIGTREDIERALDLLLATLAVQLERAAQGVRRIDFALYRVDGAVQRIAIGTSAPSRSPAHLRRLFFERIETIDPGFGIELAVLSVTETAPLGAQQLGLRNAAAKRHEGPVDELVDRLQNRLGRGRVVRLRPVDSHLPERAFRLLPADAALTASPIKWPQRDARPLMLLPQPEPIDAIAELPDHPPAQFLWRRLRRRVVRADGPERIEPEWWRERTGAMARLIASLPQTCDVPEDSSLSPDPALRDYYRVEDESGRRFWLFRVGLGQKPRWYVHGVFP